MLVFIASYVGGICGGVVHGAMKVKGRAQDAGLGYEGRGTHET